MNRRELLKLASSVFATLAFAETARPMSALFVETVAGTQDWKPSVFTPHQNDTVVALIDTIIPRTDTAGASDARVNRYLDLFLEAGKPEEKKQFLDGLQWLDDQSAKQHARPFADSTPEQRAALLEPLERDDTASPDSPGHHFFRQAKTMTAIIYFNTPEGYKELNKFGPPPATVGCTHQ